MFLRELDTGFEKIKGAGTAAKNILERLGITDIKSLLSHYPRDYEDRSVITPLENWKNGRVCTKAKVILHEWFGYGYSKTLKIHIEDDTTRAVLICFNRPFLQKQFPPGMEINVYGNFEFRYGAIQSTSFEISEYKAGDSSNNRILPVYPLSSGLTQSKLQDFVRQALKLYVWDIQNELPQFIISRDDLLSKTESLNEIHFPSSFAEKDRAVKTLVYEELFYLQMTSAYRVKERKKTYGINRRVQSPDFTSLQKRLMERLPFKLTSGQIDAINEINADMDGVYPMARLLQGDVGSGKTLVAFLACLKAAENGQACLMAPTELLARQHAENAARLVEPLGIKIAYLTGNIKSKGRAMLLNALKEGEIDLVVGTHALFSSGTEYNNLKLVVVDEQHRFGVTQRKAIMEKGEHPGLLMMSATPIPRTLALTAYGDLDITIIRDMPPGRKQIKTHLNKASNADKVYNFVRKELQAGRQAYFVYPLIEATQDRDLKDAETMAEKLSKEIFPEYTVALIHSRLDEENKRQIMEAFRNGEIRILAATSVVEVGVDVPNASCMVVEHAERFGLAALHQLRGRVGRGEAQSYCFLIYADQEIPHGLEGVDAGLLSEAERSREGKRLMVMLDHTDGFIIAEKDLLFRGPGQITGYQQSGYLALGIADLVRDVKELERAREDAFAIIENDPNLDNADHHVIKAVLERAPPFGEIVL